MLYGKNIAQKDPLRIEYDRPYFEYATGDPLQVLVKKSEGKQIELNGKPWTGTEPALPVSIKAEENELLDSAITYFSEHLPQEIEYTPLNEKGEQIKDKEGKYVIEKKSVSGIHWLLKYAGEGYNWVVRKDVLDSNKPLDLASEQNKIRKSLKAIHPEWSEARIEKQLKLMQEAAEEEETAGAAA